MVKKTKEKEMKQVYQRPETEVIQISSRLPLLTGSFIHIGGSGGFDAKGERNWDDEMEESADDESIWGFSGHSSSV